MGRYTARMPKSVLGLRVGWIDFGSFGDPIDFFHRRFDLLRFFLSPAWNDEKEMKILSNYSKRRCNLRFNIFR